MSGIFADEEVALAHRVRQRIREGWSNEEIGAEFHMHPSVVNWYLLLWYTYMTDAGEGRLERVLTFDERVFRYENLLCPTCSATLKESFFASSGRINMRVQSCKCGYMTRTFEFTEETVDAIIQPSVGLVKTLMIPELLLNLYRPPDRKFATDVAPAMIVERPDGKVVAYSGEHLDIFWDLLHNRRELIFLWEMHPKLRNLIAKYDLPINLYALDRVPRQFVAVPVGNVLTDVLPGRSGERDGDESGAQYSRVRFHPEYQFAKTITLADDMGRIEQNFLTVEELGQTFSVDPMFIQELYEHELSLGHVTPFKRVGTKLLARDDEFVDWVKQHGAMGEGAEDAGT